MGGPGLCATDPAISVPAAWAQAVPVYAGLYALIGGAASFSGWLLDVQRLTDWFGTGVSIQPNAALLTALAGVALLLVRLRYARVVILLGALIALVGTLTLTQYIVSADFGFNHQLLFGRQWGQATTLTRGRVGPPASTSFALIGLSIVILGLSRRGWAAAHAARRLVPPLALIVCTFMLFSLSGYCLGARQFYTVPWLTAIALQTASMLMGLGLGLLALVPERNPVRLLLEPTGAALIARRVLPLLVAVPTLVAWLRTKGEELALYDPGTGRALAVIVLIVSGVALMWGALETLRRHELALRQSEARLRGIIEQLPAGVGVMDTDGRWLLTNSAMHRWNLGATPSWLYDDAGRWRFWDESGAAVDRADWPGQRALRGETVLPGMEGLYTADGGRQVWMRVSAAPLRDDQGRIIGATAVVEDIDLAKRFRHHLEEELRKRTGEVQLAERRLAAGQRLAAVGTMASGLAHDIKNVLLPLSMAVDGVLSVSSGLSADGRRDLTVLTALIDHLRAMSNNLSLFARDPAHEGTEGITLLTPWRNRVERLFESSLAGNALPGNGASIRVRWEIPDRLPPVNIAPHRLTQAVLNLVHNGRDAILVGRRQPGRESTGCITIGAAARADGSAIVLEVRDDGCGMDHETMRRSVEPFFTTKDRPEVVGVAGSGLGFSLAHALCERAGGKLEIESRPGAGTSVKLVLPIVGDRTTP